MAWQVQVVMMGSAPSLAKAAEAVLLRLGTIDVRLTGRFYEPGGDQGEVALEPGWDAKVNDWSGVAFGVVKTGPVIHIVLQKVGDAVQRATVSISGNALLDLYADRRQHDSVFYARVLQIALALDARAGLGDVDSAIEDFLPRSEQEVEQAVAASLKGGVFIVTERREGYWLLEHPNLIEVMGTD
jgi:hypothetical protein